MITEKHIEQLIFTVVLYLFIALFKWDLGWFFDLSPGMMIISALAAPLLYHAAMNSQKGE